MTAAEPTQPIRQSALKIGPTAPGVHINLEIHISADATADQIDKSSVPWQSTSTNVSDLLIPDIKAIVDLVKQLREDAPKNFVPPSEGTRPLNEFMLPHALVKGTRRLHRTCSVSDQRLL